MPLDEFAAAVAATDLLVTVDTMAAHCAGALGHPVWLMLPLSPHWCWGIGRGQPRGTQRRGCSARPPGGTGRIHSRSSRASSVRYQLNIN
jgi:ADP-heptose:LPS heptosyltransferase